MIFSLTDVNKLKNKALKYKQWNCVLKIENHIISTKLHGLYKCFSDIFCVHSSLNKLQHEWKQLGQLIEKMYSSESLIIAEGSELISTSRLLRDNINSILEFKKNSEEKLGKVLHHTKNKIKGLQDLNTKLFTEKVYLEDININLENQISKLHSELASLHKKHYKTHDTGDLVCNHCKKVYNETDNFNWSCMTHISRFTDGVYWCCGSTDKSSQGCKVTKHTPTEHLLEGTGNNNELFIFCSVIKK